MAKPMGSGTIRTYCQPVLLGRHIGRPLRSLSKESTYKFQFFQLLTQVDKHLMKYLFLPQPDMGCGKCFLGILFRWEGVLGFVPGKPFREGGAFLKLAGFQRV